MSWHIFDILFPGDFRTEWNFSPRLPEVRRNEEFQFGKNRSFRLVRKDLVDIWILKIICDFVFHLKLGKMIEFVCVQWWRHHLRIRRKCFFIFISLSLCVCKWVSCVLWQGYENARASLTNFCFSYKDYFLYVCILPLTHIVIVHWPVTWG